MDNAPNTAPISSHPAFKWAVATWFAALCGLGLLGILINSPAVYAVIARTTGLAEVLPDGAVVPALALIAALFGLLLGLVIAARVSAASKPEGELENAEPLDGEPTVWLGDADGSPVATGRSRRLFNPREDLDDEGIAAPAAPDSIDAVDLPPHDSFPDDQSVDAASSALMDEWREETGFAAPAPAEEVLNGPIVSSTQNDDELEDFSPPAEPEHSSGFDEWSAPEDEADADPELGSAPFAEPGQPTAVAEQRESPQIERPMSDMSLPELTDRLRAALVSSRQADRPVTADEDQVVTFLRREADRTAPPEDHSPDPQAVLRSALDKLSRVSNSK